MLERYLRAEQLVPANMLGKARNLEVMPHWTATGALWYVRQQPDGIEYIAVDPQTGRRHVIFTAEEVKSGIVARLAQMPVQHLPASLAETEINEQIRVAMAHEIAASQARDKLCERSPRAKYERKDPPLVAPDGRTAVLQRAYNLHAVDMQTGREWQLTEDGEENNAYGRLPDDSFVTLPARKSGHQYPPYTTVWSPDSRIVLTQRFDQRHVKVYPYVDAAPADGAIRPRYHELRMPLTGDRELPIPQFYAIDVRSGASVRVDLPLDEEIILGEGQVWWRDDGRYAYTVAFDEPRSYVRLVEIDTSTGRTRTVLREEAKTYIDLTPTITTIPNVRVLADRNEFIWYSERDGWGHLYLYDLSSGRLKRQLTRGQWVVTDIVRVDSGAGRVFFAASGREAGQDPYYKHLYRVDLSSARIASLTPENADHAFTSPAQPTTRIWFPAPCPIEKISPDATVFVDTYSRVDTVPVSVLRSARDGRIIAELERADVAGVYATGWRPPRQFKVKASDGVTDLYGTMWLPSDFDPAKRYPLVDAAYGGPIGHLVPKSFAAAYAQMNPPAPAALAELGFVVITVDGRGTPGRSKAFHDATHRNLGEFGIGDQVAAIRNLAKQHPFIDLDRVGIYGHSYGGYGSLRAMLLYPEFFKVGVSSAGSWNYQGIKPILHQYHGLPVYSDGSHFNPTGSEIPSNYASVDVASMIDKLQGKLLLSFSDLDENAPPGLAAHTISALVKANKDFDLVYLPSRDHFYLNDPYMMRRIWDHFVRNLRGEQPPQNFRIRYDIPGM